MEHILNSATNAVSELEKLHPDIKDLLAYYGSREWFDDLEADNKGELPADLRRGVLSEDAVYDLISKIREIEAQIKKLH